MTKKRLLALGAAATIAACAFASSALALQGGAPDGNQHPYVGGVVVAFPDGNQLCSGFLVDSTTVVTAAHCFVDENGNLDTNPLYVLFDPGPAFGGSIDPAVAFAIDPAFRLKPGGLSSSDRGDVAVVKLAAPIELSEYGQLPGVGYDDTLPNNQKIDNVGYGLPHAGVRQVVTDKIIPGGGATGANFLKISGGDTCFGDSGGPNLQAGTNIVLAINSYGPSASCNAVSYSQRLDTQQVHDFITHDYVNNLNVLN